MRIQNRSGFLGLVLLASTNSFGNESREFRWGGRLGLGVLSEESQPTQERWEMRLEAETRRKEQVKAVVELRAGQNSRNILINDAFVDAESKSERTRTRFGRGKKILGWEFEESPRQRVTVRRSALYQYLGDRALVGRDYFLSVEGGREKGSSTETRAAAHFDEAKNLALILSLVHAPSTRWSLGTWFIVQRNESQHQDFGTAGGMLSGRYLSREHRVSVESFLGHDPERTKAERDFGGGDKVALASAKLDYTYFAGDWAPYLVSTYIVRDLRNPEDSFFDQLLGVRYFFNPDLSFSLEGSLRSHTLPDSSQDSTLKRKTALLFARYFF